MPTWIVYQNTSYDAVPWPFGKSWAAFVESPEALVHVTNDFGRASPCDGLSETPSVPAHLPREVPFGKYGLAMYHDAEWLYVFLQVLQEPPRHPTLENESGTLASVTVFSPNGRFIQRYQRNDDGKLVCKAAPAVYGPRKIAYDGPTPSAEHRAIRIDGHAVDCWRIARSGLPASDGNQLALSVSHAFFGAMEPVAWGSYQAWDPRIDQAGTVRLVEARKPSPWPILRRVDLQYDQFTEHGRFRFVWEDIYRDEEATTAFDLAHMGPLPWLKFSLWLNHRQILLPLTAESISESLPIGEGDNLIRVATGGGPMTEFSFEKRSGTRIYDSHLPLKATKPTAWVNDQIREACDQVIAANEARRARGEALVFRPWATYRASSLGRVYHYFHKDPRLLEILREEADLALSEQRTDGTYAGFHLRDVKPAPWRGGAYDTGQAGELWIVAAQLFGDAKYLEASTRLVKAYAGYRVEFNHNYASFALYHLVAHYRHTGDPLALEHAIFYCKSAGAADILPLGYQSGHNYYSVYGAITLRGIALLAAVLPKDHSYRATLRELCIRMTNQVISRLQPEGLYDARDRHYLGLRLWIWGIFPVAFLLPAEDVARLDRVVQRMLHAPPKKEEDRTLVHPLCESEMVRYLAHRDRLLAGEPIDLMKLI